MIRRLLIALAEYVDRAVCEWAELTDEGPSGSPDHQEEA